MEGNTLSERRDYLLTLRVALGAFLSGSVLFFAMSAWGTSIGTQIYGTANIFATSSLQATGNIIGYADLFVGGTSTQALADFALSGDAYIHGGLGVGNATTTDGNVEVSGRVLTTKLAVGTGTGNVVSRFAHGSCTIDPPELKAAGNPASIGHAACTDATGLTTSDNVLVGVEGGVGWLNDVLITSASTTANNTINFIFQNVSTTTTRDIPSGVHIYYLGLQ